MNLHEKDVYTIKNDIKVLIYSKIYKEERLILQHFIPNYKPHHYLIYAYLKENINLKEFRKSHKTIAEALNISRATVIRVFKDFIKLNILKITFQEKGLPVTYNFNQLLTEKKEINPEIEINLYKKQAEPVSISNNPVSNSNTNINKDLYSYKREDDINEHEKIMKAIESFSYQEDVNEFR